MTMTAHPALVLNADFRPMSYFPLSLLSWQDAVHAVFSERVVGRGRVRRVGAQPVHADPAAVRGGAAQVPASGAARGLHALQRVPARPLHVPVLRRGVCIFGADVRARHPALARRPDDVVEHRHGLRAVQHGQGQLAAHQTAAPAEGADAQRAAGCQARVFRPAICTRAGRTTSTGTRSSRPSFVS